jgi:hypothetical protein
MEFEGVGAVAVGCVSFEIFGEVDDLYGFEWAFFDADSASCVNS